MERIELRTAIIAEIEIVFDLARSLDLHEISMSKSKEKAVGGRTSGLIEMGESVIWEATHLGFRQRLESKITGFDRPNWFQDKQVSGAFKEFTHDHYFKKDGELTIMRDVFEFDSPLGIIGVLFNKLFLTEYMKNLLRKRNYVIKHYAQSGKFKEVLMS